MCLKNMFAHTLLATTTLICFLENAKAADLPIGHFGTTNYGDWISTGTSFNLGPARPWFERPASLSSKTSPRKSNPKCTL